MSDSKQHPNGVDKSTESATGDAAEKEPIRNERNTSSELSLDNETALAERAQGNIAAFKEALKIAGGNGLTQTTPPMSEKDTLQVQIDTVGEHSGAAVSFTLPERLGKFRLIRPLGEGGFGRVFLGFDPDLERHVAIKVPKPTTLISDDSRRRLGIEARATSILTHFNIVPVYESASHGPFQFLVSAYCPGPTLAEWLQQRETPVELRFAAEMTRSVALAIYHAHQRDIIHRDIKPGNLILECESRQDVHSGNLNVETEVIESAIPDSELSSRVRVTDFGLARILQEVDRSLTQDGAIVGTPNYLAPEQVNGAGDLTPATDVYSLGVVLYELLCLQIPFERENVTATLNAVCHDLPTPPRSLRSDIDRDLEAICLKCLEKSPSDRYQTMAELANDLDSWLAGLPTQARPVTRLQRCQKWIYRNPIVTLLGFALAAATVFSLVGYFDAIHQRRIAETASERANRQRAITQTAINELAADVARMDSLPRDVRLPLIRQADELQQALLKENPDDLETLFETQKTKLNWAMLLYEAGDLEMSESFLSDGIARLERYREHSAMELLRSSYVAHLIKVYRTSGKLDAALSLAEVEFQTLRDNAPTGHKYLSTQANALADQGRFSEAAARAEQALVLLLSEPEQTPSIRGYYISTLRILAVIEMDQGDYRIARVTLEEALELANQLASEMPYHQSMMIEGFLILIHLSECEFELGNDGAAAEKLDVAGSVINEVVDYDASNDHLVKYLSKLYRVRILHAISNLDSMGVHTNLDELGELLTVDGVSGRYVQYVAMEAVVAAKKVMEQLIDEPSIFDIERSDLLQHAVDVSDLAESIVEDRLVDNDTYRKQFRSHVDSVDQMRLSLEQ